ncbi:glycosyltransferase family A protein [Paucibacter sp. AS339]|uniref:glycosyltransferase family 2 protein n=1 Tax=Paucibacter hankyongi TaxID=3133434 RepID=UPI0030A5279E
MEMNLDCSISVVIATFGAEEWRKKAKIAARSVLAQSLQPKDLQLIHGATLCAARNEAAKNAQGEWLLFLDADDSLAPGYLAAMQQAIRLYGGLDCLLQPSTSFVVNGSPKAPPAPLPPYPILEQNYLIVATLVRRDKFLQVGGFRELDMFEDWDLWLRCLVSGSQVRVVPDAVYEVTFNPKGRNKTSVELNNRITYELRAKYWPQVYGGTLPNHYLARLYFEKKLYELRNLFRRLISAQ